MSSYLLPILVVAALFAAMTLSRRTRARALQQQIDQREQIRFGTDVMTTSGLYGTVVGLNDDDTVQLAIAPGIEVKWALAAVRDVASLPKNTARSVAADDDTGDQSDPSGSDSNDSSDPPTR